MDNLAIKVLGCRGNQEPDNGLLWGKEMKTISTGDFKINLSSVLKNIMEGEEYIMSYGKKK